jgi:AcrR family transcriptional regulator
MTTKSRTNDPDGVRRRILDAAASLFQGRGYNSATIHDIVEASGVTSGGLHHHFPSKKAIGLAVLRERVGPEVEATWLVPLAGAKSAAAGLDQVFRSIERGLDERQAVQGCPLNNLALELSLADPGFRQEIERLFARWRSGILAKLSSDKRGGRLEDRDPGRLATLVLAAYSGAMAMAKAEQSTRPLKACRRELLRQLKD